MTVIDPSTNLGKLRLRVADWGDVPFLPDVVYTQTLADNDNNLFRSSVIVGTYLLGMFSQKTHRRLSVQLEVYGNQAFEQYKQYLTLIVKDPAYSGVCPIAYSGTPEEIHAIKQFQDDWNKNFTAGTQSQKLAVDAAISPNDGSVYGPLGSGSRNSGWQLTENN